MTLFGKVLFCASLMMFQPEETYLEFLRAFTDHIKTPDLQYMVTQQDPFVALPGDSAKHHVIEGLAEFKQRLLNSENFEAIKATLLKRVNEKLREANNEIKLNEVSKQEVQTLEKTFTAGKRTSYSSISSFSKDGKMLAIARADDFAVDIWNVEKGTVAKTLKYSVPFNTIDFSPDGSKLVSGNGEELLLWDLSKKVPEVIADSHSEFEKVAFSPLGNFIFYAAGTNHSLYRLATEDSKPTPTVRTKSKSDEPVQVKFSPDEKYLVVDARGLFTVINLQTTNHHATTGSYHIFDMSKEHRMAAAHVSWKRLPYGGGHKKHYSFEVTNLGTNWPLRADSLDFSSITSISFSEDGRQLTFIGVRNGVYEISGYDWRSKKQTFLYRYGRAGATVNPVYLSPDRKFAYTYEPGTNAIKKLFLEAIGSSQ